MTIDADLVAQRVAALRERIDRLASRPVRIVAVTKRFGPDAVIAAAGAGVDAVAENYAQELLDKRAQVAAICPDLDIPWHFVGRLQRNKVKKLAGVVALWHTIDGERLGGEVAKRQPGAPVLVQVNTTDAEGQGGVDVAAVPELVRALTDLGLDVQGLMTIGRLGDPEATSGAFSALRYLADDLGLEHCSMGMSDDLDLALAAGTTMVRIGTALFGPRPESDAPR